MEPFYWADLLAPCPRDCLPAPACFGWSISLWGNHLCPQWQVMWPTEAWWWEWGSHRGPQWHTEAWWWGWGRDLCPQWQVTWPTEAWWWEWGNPSGHWLWFTSESYQTFKVNTRTSKTILKIEKGIQPNSFIKQNHPTIKTNRNITKKENYWPKSSAKYQQTEFNDTLEVSHTIIKWDLSQGCKNGSASESQSARYTVLTNWRRKTGEKKHLTKSTSVYDKNSQQIQCRGNIPQHNKSHIWQTFCP